MEQQIHITLWFHLATGKVNLNEIVFRLQELKNPLMLHVLEKILRSYDDLIAERLSIYRLCRKYLRLALPEKRLEVLNPVHSFRHSCAVNMLAAGCSVTDIKNQLGHEDIQSTMVYLQMDLTRRRKIQQRFTEYTQAVLNRNAAIEALIAQEEKEDIMTWLDSL